MSFKPFYLELHVQEAKHIVDRRSPRFSLFMTMTGTLDRESVRKPKSLEYGSPYDRIVMVLERVCQWPNARDGSMSRDRVTCQRSGNGTRKRGPTDIFASRKSNETAVIPCLSPRKSFKADWICGAPTTGSGTKPENVQIFCPCCIKNPRILYAGKIQCGSDSRLRLNPDLNLMRRGLILVD